MQHFDIVSIAQTIDWFNIMSYDLHDTWDSTDPFIGAVVGAHTNLTEIDLALQLLWRNNIDPPKVALGLGFYGRSYTLANPLCTAPGCPFSEGAPKCSGWRVPSQCWDIIFSRDQPHYCGKVQL
jgi:chitinase